MESTATTAIGVEIPEEETLREAYGPGSRYRSLVLDALRKPRDLCWELGVLNRRWTPFWKALGIWAPPGA